MANNVFLSSDQKSIDFVLVYKSSKLTEKGESKLEYFLASLLRTGLDLEVDAFSADKDTIFVKIHASRDIVIRYSDTCDVDLAFRSLEYRPAIPPPFRFMATPLTLPDPQDEVYQRAPNSVSGEIPQDVTSAEKILVLYKLMNRTKFGNEYSEYGVDKLLEDKVFIDYYPTHEGPYNWTERGPLTDRQLLAKFWGSANCWYKVQPLNMVERYYGTEVAFYFAWLGFYLKMLIPAAILSVLCVAYGVITINSIDNVRSEEICDSDVLMCPRCHYIHCKYEKLSNSCLYSYLTYLDDNPATIAFAVAISFWSTIFMELWQRSEAVLQLEWNVKSLEHDTSMRPEYAEHAPRKKYSPITHEFEPYVPKGKKIARYVVTLSSIALLLMIMVIATFGVMVYRITVTLLLMRDSKEEIVKKNTQLIASVTGSIISASIIFVFKVIYPKLALWLTNLENHRTQPQFDNSYIYKCYALEFTNSYSAVFYIAFFKGRFFTHPGDMSLWTFFGGLGSDICDPTGCILDLSVQLLSIMVMKILVNNFMQVIVPILEEFVKRKLHRIKSSNIPPHEKEYLMSYADRYFLINEYIDMVIQYGFVVFFVAGFPPAPFLALINNIIELRVDAYKLTRSFRRPIPKKVMGLGAWFGILQAVTYMGVVTNALVIAFTSNFVPKEIYRHQVDSTLKGFTKTTLSAFSTNEFYIAKPKATIPDLCYYPGKRYPPDHEQRYQLTTDYWFVLAIRFLVVVVFEHVVISLKGILAYAIPDVPAYVTEQLAVQERKNKEARMKVLNETYLGRRDATGFSSIVRPID